MTIDPKNLSATATLTFSDEFNSLSLWNGTSGTWSTKYPFAPDKGGSLPSNGEQEWYINSMYAPTTSVKPWTVSNGVLTLTAQPASGSVQPLIDGYQYTSGMINTYNSFSQQYGYFEMRAQLPAGQGLWPAFWLLQTDMSWPPEIDVMEVLGHDLTTLYTAAHTNQTGSHTSQGGTIKVPNMSQSYHTYGVDWQKDYITYYFDGNQVWKTATPSDMNEPMYMIANLAVGGYWPGMVNGTTPFPAQMKIDYIRAYSDKGVAPPTNPPPTEPPPTTPDPPLMSKLFSLPTSGGFNLVVRGTSGNDTLTGTSSSNKIDGRAGADKMSGGAGNDTYLVDNPGDIIIENANSGVDTVQSKASSYTLSANVENLKLAGNGAQTGIGNALGNLMTGNSAASTLNGGDGNDILVAGKGANVLTGGAGSDIFQFNSLPQLGGSHHRLQGGHGYAGSARIVLSIPRKQSRRRRLSELCVGWRRWNEGLLRFRRRGQQPAETGDHASGCIALEPHHAGGLVLQRHGRRRVGIEPTAYKPAPHEPAAHKPTAGIVVRTVLSADVGNRHRYGPHDRVELHPRLG